MSGHNKWSKIKHKKAAVDAKKSKIFSKLSKLISAESKVVGGDINSPTLRTIIEKAKKENMPKENIERAIKKGANKDAISMERVVYEAYGPGGVAMIIDCLTDNKNRAAAEIKHVLSKNNLSLSEMGSASWAFENTGDGWEAKTLIDVNEENSKKLEEIIENIEDGEDVQWVYTNKKK